LIEALKELDYSILENHLLINPEDHDHNQWNVQVAINDFVGFKWNGNEYELVTDLMFWKQPYSVDKFLNQVNQRYAYNSIIEASEKQNFNYVKSQNLVNGTMRVVLRRYK
jgi:hypothetical protein